MKGRECRNCGWGGPKDQFFSLWCLDCALAFVKGVSVALATTLAADVLRDIIRAFF